MSKALCVTGMHRSGTSLTMGWLAQCGLIYHDGKPLEPTTGNTRGHFEDAEFAMLQHQAILDAYPRSKGWVVTDRQAPEHLSLPVDAAELVKRRNSKFPLWGWKDPRTMHFLAAWKALVPSMKTLIVWRHPVEVVDSLLRRSAGLRGAQGNFLRIGEDEAFALWNASNEQGLAYCLDHPADTMLVALADLLKLGEELIREMNRRFSMSLTATPVVAVFEPSLLKQKPNRPSSRSLPSAVSKTLKALGEHTLQL